MSKTINRKHEINSVYITNHLHGGVYVMYKYLGGAACEIASSAKEAVDLLISRDVWLRPGSPTYSANESTRDFLKKAALEFDKN